MRYRQLLERIPHDLLARWMPVWLPAQDDGATGGGALSQSRATAALGRWSDGLSEARRIEGAFWELSRAARLLLWVVLASSGPAGGVRPVLAHHRLASLTGRQGGGEAAFHELTRAGLLFRLRLPGDVVAADQYVVPEEARRTLWPLFARELAGGPFAAGEPRSDPGPDEDVFRLAAVVHDLVLLLACARDQRPAFTRQGTFFRRVQRSLLARFWEPEEPGGDALYPPRLAFLLRYASSRGLVEAVGGSEGARLVATPRARVWAEAPEDRRAADLVRFVWEASARAGVTLDPLWRLLASLPPGRPVNWRAVLGRLERYTVTPGFPAHLAGRAEQVLSPLAWLGAVREAGPGGLVLTRTGAGLLGRTDAGGEGWLPPRESRFYLQPNLEILIPRHLDPAVLYELAAWADGGPCEPFVTYRLNRPAVLRALRTGFAPGRILEFLEAHARGPVPQNVAYTVQEWTAGRGRAELIDALVLRVSPPEAADGLAAVPGVAPYLGGELAPGLVLVDRRGFREVLAALEEAGYHVRDGVWIPAVGEGGLRPRLAPLPEVPEVTDSAGPLPELWPAKEGQDPPFLRPAGPPWEGAT